MTKQAFERRLRAQSKMWDTLLESLETSVYRAKAEARAACARDYDMLCTKGNEVAEKLAEAEGTQKVVRIPADHPLRGWRRW